MQVVSLILKNYLFTFGLDTHRALNKLKLIAKSGPWFAAKAMSPWTADWQGTCWGLKGSFWLKELPIKMSRWTKLNVWESSSLRRHLIFWNRSLLGRCMQIGCILSLVVQLVDCNGNPHMGAPLLLCGEKPFSSSNLTLKKKEKMPLPETEIHSGDGDYRSHIILSRFDCKSCLLFHVE